MSYTVKLAMFPPWKAPVPTEMVGTFATIEQAAAAGRVVLMPIAERELSALGNLRAASAQVGGQSITHIDVPDTPVHGFVIYDTQGTEVGNYTTLDAAVERAAPEKG